MRQLQTFIANSGTRSVQTVMLFPILLGDFTRSEQDIINQLKAVSGYKIDDQ